MKYNLTRGQIAAANLKFAQINRAAQNKAVADEIAGITSGQKILKIRKDTGTNHLRGPCYKK